MKPFAATVCLNALLLLLAEHVVRGLATGGVLPLLAAAVLLAVLNLGVQAVIPATRMPWKDLRSLLIYFAANAAMLYAVGLVIRGFHVRGVLVALAAGLVFGLCNLAVLALVTAGKRRR
jgi:uncharacterized membrane protein YvlD (DUF360 family)